MNLKGTKTASNLMASFAGESQARMRYDFWAGIAKKEGYVQIANVFTETAEQERSHAKRFFKFLNDDPEIRHHEVSIEADFPVLLGNTAENLKSAAEGENEEHAHLYPEFARIAKEEGFPELANLWNNISIAEEFHENRFLKLYNDLLAGTTFIKAETTDWKCNNCGYVLHSKQAPKVCPACDHAQAHFEVNTFFFTK